MATQEQRNRTLIFALLCVCAIILVSVTTCQSRDNAHTDTALGEGVGRLGDSPVAQVNGTQIYLSDVQNAAIAQKIVPKGTFVMPSDLAFQQVLSELIDQRLMALEAMQRSLDQNRGAQQRLAQAREQILSSLLVEAHLRQIVTEDDARQIFDAQASLRERGIEVRARQIVLPDQPSADEVWARLEKGESFAALALAFSMDRASRENAGDLGFFTDDMLGPVLTQKAFAAAVGERIGPFKSEMGWHIVEVMGRRDAPEPTFDDMREDIMNLMTYEAIDGLLGDLRAASRVKRLPIKPGSTPKPKPKTE